MMSPRKVLLALGVSVLVGCGRNDQPTVRHSSSDSGSSKSTEKSADSASQSAAIAQKKRTEKDDSKTAAKLTDLKVADTKPADAKTLNSADEKPAVSPAEMPDAAGNAKQSPKTDATANAAKPPATTGPDAGNAASQANVVPSTAHDITAPVPSGKPMTTEPAGKQPPSESQRDVKLGGMQLVAPESWKRKRPRLKILLAEFSIAASKQGSPEAQLTVTQTIKDDPKAIDQLRDEIKDEEQSKDATVTRLRIADHDVILVDSTDTDEGSSTPTSAGGNRYRSLNAMVFIGGSVFFVTCSGPETTVTERVGEFHEFLQTLKSIDQPR
jgi:hypothetical protein